MDTYQTAIILFIVSWIPTFIGTLAITFFIWRLYNRKANHKKMRFIIYIILTTIISLYLILYGVVDVVSFIQKSNSTGLLGLIIFMVPFYTMTIHSIVMIVGEILYFIIKMIRKIIYNKKQFKNDLNIGP